MKNYSWPGNVRELKNFVERAVLMSADYRISIPDITGFIDNVPNVNSDSSQEGFSRGNQDDQKEDDYLEIVKQGISISQYLDEKECAFLKWAQDAYGSTYKMAEALGTSQAGIMRRKKKYGL